MPLVTPPQFQNWLEKLGGKPPQAILIFGEPFLCREKLAQIEALLLKNGGMLHPLDGEEENVRETLAKLANYSLLGGRQIYRVSDTRLFYSKSNAEALWKRVAEARKERHEGKIKQALATFVKALGISVREDALASMSAAEWQKAFAFSRPGENLDWTRPFLLALAEEGPDGGQTGDNAAEQLAELLAAGLPAENMLILVAAAVDKRKKLFKYLQENEAVIDCSVTASGGGAKKEKERNAILDALAGRLLTERGKKLAPNVLAPLRERVGFNPAAMVSELEKLILFVGERAEITRDDLDEMVGLSREEALYELGQAISGGVLADAFFVLDRLLLAGVHPLAILAGLRAQTRKLLLFGALLEARVIPFTRGMNFSAFQNQCLPVVQAQSEWQDELAGHPYALYSQFQTASGLPLARLAAWMRLFLEAESRLKQTGASEKLILHRLVTALFGLPETELESVCK